MIVAVDADAYRELGGLAIPVWMLLDRPRGPASVAAELVDLLPDAPADVAGRVEDTLVELVERGLVERVLAVDDDPGEDSGDGAGPAAGVYGAEEGVARTAQGDAHAGTAGALEDDNDGAGRLPGAEDHDVVRAVSIVDESTPGGDELVDEVMRSLLVMDSSASQRLFDAVVPESMPEEVASTLVSRATAGRLTGPLLWRVHTGDLRLPDEVEAALRERHRGALLWCLHLERRLLWFLDRVEAAGIDPIVLKGPAIAHLDRSDPSLRTFADLDLLIPPALMDTVVDLLLAEGGQRPWPQRRPGFDARFAKSVTVTLPDGVEMDLHRTLCDGVHGLRIPVEELHAAPEFFDVAGRPVRALNREHRLLHAAYHAVLGSSTPAGHSLSDLVGYFTEPEIDVDRVVWTARRWRGTAVLAAAFDATVDAVGLDAAVAPRWWAWRESVSVSVAEWAIVDGQRRDGSSFGVTRLDAWAELPSRGDQLAYAAAILWPTREHLRARGRRRRDVFSTVTSRLRRRG